MQKKCVVLGVSGGIAVYKALDVVSRLKKQDIEVHVIMTKSATEFVTPLSFQALSQNMVITDMFAEPKAFEIQHISLAKIADIVAVIPATANILGKIANGIADDMLSTTIMATKAPVVFAPAMNTNMYKNPIVKNNINILKQYGYEFIGPSEGRLACGDIGSGKLSETNLISEVILSKLNQSQDLVGKTVLVTAGPTISPIDPVRYITNKSTGKMGYEIAKEARDRGASVILIAGPTSLENPLGINIIKVKTNEDMHKAVLENFSNSDIVIKSAAVGDYKVKTYSNEKIKKKSDTLNIELIKDNDILKDLGEKKKDQILVGFAAESDDLLKNAKDKLKRKNIDFIVVNDITKDNIGFASDNNKVTIISKSGEIMNLDIMSKRMVAKELFDIIKKR